MQIGRWYGLLKTSILLNPSLSVPTYTPSHFSMTTPTSDTPGLFYNWDDKGTSIKNQATAYFWSQEEAKILDQRIVWQLLKCKLSCWSPVPSVMLPMKNAEALPLGPHPTGSSYLWFHWNETVCSSAWENWPFNRPAVIEVVVILQGPDLQRQEGKNIRELTYEKSSVFLVFH